MKTTLLIAILTLGLLPGMSSQADAGHPQCQSQIFISGYQRCGTPIYKVRYVSGYTSCGAPIWRVRNISNRELRGHQHRQQRVNHASGDRGCHSQAGYGRAIVRYSTSSGRGNTTIYSSGYRGGSCRSW